jgi:hypothetical protein
VAVAVCFKEVFRRKCGGVHFLAQLKGNNGILLGVDDQMGAWISFSQICVSNCPCTRRLTPGRNHKTLRATREAEGDGASSTTPATWRRVAKCVATAVTSDWPKGMTALQSIPFVFTR